MKDINRENVKGGGRGGARGLDDVHDVFTTREVVLLSRGQRIIAVYI